MNSTTQQQRLLRKQSSGTSAVSARISSRAHVSNLVMYQIADLIIDMFLLAKTFGELKIVVERLTSSGSRLPGDYTLQLEIHDHNAVYFMVKVPASSEKAYVRVSKQGAYPESMWNTIREQLELTNATFNRTDFAEEIVRHKTLELHQGDGGYEKVNWKTLESDAARMQRAASEANVEEVAPAVTRDTTPPVTATRDEDSEESDIILSPTDGSEVEETGLSLEDDEELSITTPAVSSSNGSNGSNGHKPEIEHANTSEAEAASARHYIAELEERIANLQQDRSDLEARLAERTQEVGEKNAELFKLEEQLEKKQSECDSAIRRASEAEAELNSTTTTIAKLKAEISDLEDTITELRSTTPEPRDDTSSSEQASEITSLRRNLTRKSNQVDQLKAELAALQEQPEQVKLPTSSELRALPVKKLLKFGLRVISAIKQSELDIRIKR